MTTQAPTWYREIIRDKVRHRYQSMGGFLDGTMVQGDGGAGTIKFPVGGRLEDYEMSGSIEDVPNTNPNIDMLEVGVRDWEVSAWIRKQDERRSGVSEHDFIAKAVANAIRRRRDNIRLAALHDFCENGAVLQDNPTTPLTIGDGSAVIDILHLINGVNRVRGKGSDDGALYWPIPYSWMGQLEMYEEIKNSRYAGPEDLPFAKAAVVQKRTVRGVHMMAIPDEHFVYGTGAFGTGSNGLPFDPGGYLDTYMWGYDAVGAEIEFNKESLDVTVVTTKVGDPKLCKAQISGNAVGLIPEGVVRIRMKAINDAARPGA